MTDTSGYPVALHVESPPQLAKWRPLVQWILATPHFVILYGLNALAAGCALVAWVWILFTGKMPPALAGVIAMALRYNQRTTTYAGFLHDRFPPFAFDMTAADLGGAPVRLDVTPDLGERNRLTVGLRPIWMIPAALITFLVSIVAMVAWIVALFAVLFTGRWPEAMRYWVVKGLRYYVRLYAYVYLLTDQYPPLDFGA